MRTAQQIMYVRGGGRLDRSIQIRAIFGRFRFGTSLSSAVSVFSGWAVRSVRQFSLSDIERFDPAARSIRWPGLLRSLGPFRSAVLVQRFGGSVGSAVLSL